MKLRTNSSLFVIILLACLLLVAPVHAQSKIKIVTTTGIVADVVKNIVGDRGDVSSLMGAGVDPHLYKATQGDLTRLVSADIIFYNGLHLEGKMTEILAKLGEKKPSVAVTAKISRDHLRQPPNFPGQYDPHVWFDVNLWSHTIDQVEESLIKVDPQGEPDFSSNAKLYRDKLHDLDQRVRSKIAGIPKQQRILVTAHDAFGYFGRAYDIEVIGLQGVSTASEYGLFDLKQVTDLVISRNLRAVFVESSVPKKFVMALIEGAHARGNKLRLGGELFSDALGKEGTPEGTYQGMVEKNVETIVRALSE